MDIDPFDNGEPLVDLKVVAPELIIGPPPIKMAPYVGDAMYIRQGVVERLLKAQDHLGQKVPDAKLQIMYAYRHPEIQRGYFEQFMSKSREDFPHFSEEDLLEYAHHYIAIPEVGGHPVGGAVDLLLSQNGEQLDMGSKIGDFTDMEKVPPFSSSITQDQFRNRMILREAMILAGFAPYDFEWWHFSYGDREWACYYGQKATLYDALEFRTIFPEAESA